MAFALTLLTAASTTTKVPPPPSLNASFEGGNMNETMTRWVADNTLQYEGALKCGPASTKCSPYTNWAYFAISNLSTIDPTKLLTLSHNWLSDPWYSYTDSDDGLEWTRLTVACAGKQVGCHVHTFSQPRAFIAFSIPYVRRQRARLFTDLKQSTTAEVTVFSLATSEAGYDVSGVNISAASGGQGREEGRALIWFQAGQHAWESGGRWTSDGLARYAASADGATLLAHADVLVIPIMDIDNVVVGGAGKDSEPVDFNRDWCPVGEIARNETHAPCQHWKAIRAAVLAIRAAMDSGRYTDLVFVDSHSPGNQNKPAEVWTACGDGPSAIEPGAWNRTQVYKADLARHSATCGRLAYNVTDCAEVGPAYGNSHSGYHWMDISFTNILYKEYPEMMNRKHTRSMSFSHETAEATVQENRCYGAAIGTTLAGLLANPGPISAEGITSTCFSTSSCHDVSPPPPPGPSPPHTAGYVVVGAGDKDCNGKYLPIAHPHGADAGAPIYSKDAAHQIYRYGGTWHVAHLGVVVFYDPPPSSYWAAEPPLTGWRQFPNRSAALPAPTLSPIGV